MNENNLNASFEEVVQPQDNGAEMGEVTGSRAAGRDIDSMSDEDFASYIEMAQSGSLGEVQADDTANSRQGDAADAATPHPSATPTPSPATAYGQSPMPTTQMRRSPQGEGFGREQSGDAMPAENVQPYKTFATHEEYQAEFDRVMGERLKKNRVDMERLDGLRDLAMHFYGGEGDEALNKLINDLRDQNAERDGVSAEEFDSRMRDTADARRYREQMKAREEQQARVREIQERWKKESEDLKAVVPDFDFAKAMGNKAFYDNVINGMSVGAAYIAVNQAAVQQPQQPKRRAIAQNGNAKGASVGKIERNIDAMSDEEFSAYINSLKG